MNKSEKLAFGCLFLQTVSVFGADNATKPNVILIMTDQQSYNMVSALNKNAYTSTPNIDRLVNSGISFTNTLCANPVSVPSRFSLFTGLYGGQYKVRDNLCVDAVQTDVVPVLTAYGMGNVFKNNGYETVYSGKVHLPFAKNTNKFAQPVNYGFSTYLTNDERDILGTTAADFISKRTSTTPLLFVVSFLNPHDICLESSTNLSPNVEVDPTKPEIAATINEIRAEAAAFDSIYFYSNVAPSLPVNFDRTTNFPPKFTPSVFDNFPDYYWRKYRWIYSRLVNKVDGHIGKVLDAIDNWAQKNNTIVIFTSDHGEMQAAHHTTVKNLPYDECQHVPFIIAGKGVIPNRIDSSLICNGIDLIPTMCELAGIKIPTGLPGISVAKKALGTGNVYQRQHLYLEGDGFSQIIENASYKYTRFEVTNGINEMLIDKKNDPGELVNVATNNTIYSAKTTELSILLNQTENKNTGTTGIQNLAIKNPEVFPNPVQNVLTINSNEPIEILKIFNISGIDMSSYIINVHTQNERTVVEFNHLPKGIYFLHFNQFSAKFIVNQP